MWLAKGLSNINAIKADGKAILKALIQRPRMPESKPVLYPVMMQDITKLINAAIVTV